ncbi:MAG: Re/Si-specific NAD(P)(+) transhydrogenase subunit alpha [Alphaproteobacteria bacterium]|nr:MAG: Re/Si-specific NAD(P)(+) transhydrogenase subunit alpha [Alphaproteobacteria bacterium]
MKIAVLKERRPGETRVAAIPETVKKFIGLGANVVVETGAGQLSHIGDDAYTAAGATIAADAKSAANGADIILKVQRPEGEELGAIKAGALLVAMLSPYGAKEQMNQYASANISAFAMEFMPRITRAQTMDVLSSQSNLAGYRAVIEAAEQFGKALPMMMTAAGTIAPARALILGAGVAGLQAIATARRLGAIVSAFDVRPAVKEQVQSLGATFVEVDDDAAKNAETAGGYAKEMSEDYKRKQSLKIHETLKKTDIAISTALIPGKPAPVLITEEMVRDMKPGSVIVDMAVESGGNCPLSEAGKVVTKHGVKIIGYTNLPGRIATDASALYSRNLFNFVSTLISKETKSVKLDLNDEIVKGTLLTHNGSIVHPTFASAKAA